LVNEFADGDASKLPMSQAELEARLLRLASAIVGFKDKKLGNVAINPDEERFNFWTNLLSMTKIDLKKNRFALMAMDRIQIQGYVVGVHGNSVTELSELSRMSLALSGTDNKEIKNDGKLKSIARKITIKDSTNDKSRHLDKAKELEDLANDEDIRKLYDIEKQFDDLKEKFETEKNRPINIIHNEIPEKTKSDEKMDKKESEENNKFKGKK
jgi:hypothetical protein